ncbi:endonuclease/exonuclease/phosphatase family protein [Catellatospora sp. KI3]|uniref:endonuclease/exonuclease/phosphatase family protein n=1 Tax=Catellatospora sp. KI3 TaxID=3041620 RepID=UPI002482D3B8|nr:endonuclease/exonuclease/phosphatase family protein [Catellatospora sp. KI3]MDI1466383.1 endonuclease/exonuclease/phosphatase family protein [Catellatospora sp. KI3]
MTTIEIEKVKGVPPAKRRPWRAALVGAAAVLLALFLAGHRFVPNWHGVGSILDTVAPVFGLAIPVLVVLALLARSWRALLVVALPAVIWAAMFGRALLPPPGGPVDLRVASQNLYAENPDPATTVTALTAGAPDLLALQEASGGTLESVAEGLSGQYPYSARRSTVALLSRYPIATVSDVDTGLDWVRALRAMVRTPKGEVAVYVVHLGSARVNDTATRDRTVDMLAEAIRSDSAQRVVVLGDFNTATTDRAIAPLTDQLADAQADAGWGFGFTWPSTLPFMRPDQVLYRGLTATEAGVRRTPGTDHRAVTAGFAF